MKAIVIVFLPLFLGCSSTNIKQSSDIPKCIVSLIETYKTESKQNPPRSVTQYTWQNRTVYYIPASCCDQFNGVYDSACNYLGSPSGGFTGKGDGKMPGFYTDAVNEKIIWKDER